MTRSRRLLTKLCRKLCHSYLKNKSSTVGSTLSSAETQRTVSTACCAPGRKLPWCHIITCEAPLVRLDQAGCPPFSLLSPSFLPPFSLFSPSFLSLPALAAGVSPSVCVSLSLSSLSPNTPGHQASVDSLSLSRSLSLSHTLSHFGKMRLFADWCVSARARVRGVCVRGVWGCEGYRSSWPQPLHSAGRRARVSPPKSLICSVPMGDRESLCC